MKAHNEFIHVLKDYPDNLDIINNTISTQKDGHNEIIELKEITEKMDTNKCTWKENNFWR